MDKVHYYGHLLPVAGYQLVGQDHQRVYESETETYPADGFGPGRGMSGTHLLPEVRR